MLIHILTKKARQCKKCLCHTLFTQVINVERVNASLVRRTEIVDAFLNPFGTIPRYKLYTGQLLFAQQFEELGENCLAMSFMSPDNLACVMIDDHCYVLVSLLVAGFVNAYADKSREACGWIGIKFSPHPANDRADGIPGNPEQRGNSGFRAGQGEPSGQLLKFLCETGLMPCPNFPRTSCFFCSKYRTGKCMLFSIAIRDG